MTTATHLPTSPTPGSVPGEPSRRGARPVDAVPRLTLRRVIRSEWIKLWSVRSTVITLVAAAAVVIIFGLISAAVATGSVTPPGPGGGKGGFGSSDPLSTVFDGATQFGVLIVAVLGGLVGAREYSTGMIRTTVAAVPRRLYVLWGKAIALVAALLPVVLVAVFGAFAGGMAVLSHGGHATASLSDPDTLRAVLGTVGYITGVGLLGLALGLLLRSIASSISTLIGGLLIIPGFAALLLPSGWSAVLKYLPSNAAAAFDQVTHTGAVLGVTSGAVVFTAWVAGALAGAALVLRRRDV